MPCSFKPWATASVRPPLRAKIRPKYEALSKNVLRQVHNVHIAAVKQRLQLLKGNNAVDKGTNALLKLHFFGRAGAINTILQSGSFSFMCFLQWWPWEKDCENVIHQARETICEYSPQKRDSRSWLKMCRFQQALSTRQTPPCLRPTLPQPHGKSPIFNSRR